MEHVISLPIALQKFWIVSGVPCFWCVFYGPTGADWLTEGKAEKGGNALHFLSRLELAILWRLSGIYWIELSRFLGLRRLHKKETPKVYGLGEWFWCESIVAEGAGRKRVHGKWLTARANNCFCSWGYKAVVAKPWSWKGLLLLSESSVWPGFVCCLYFLASWPEISGKEPWGCPCGDVYSASSSLPRKASPRNLHELLGRHFAGSKDRV